ncbi:hypothetical protein CFK37_17200 [Virgibacillus phasianinus]|uniref:YppG-like protein n=1 Tax=Virgibacillus phasianinus TaxID=2017483 RepID=A0A220U6Q1_9BACI|nr:hypothetical protein CFK37_17200 [Virgibacillus phasianinus]
MLMFPDRIRQRRPMPPFSPARNRPYSHGRPSKTNLLSAFRGADGKFDLNKISETAQQMNSIYKQVSPYITKFIKK